MSLDPTAVDIASTDSWAPPPPRERAKPRLEVTVVQKSGERRLLDVEALTAELALLAEGLRDLDPGEVARRVIRGLHDGVTEAEVDRLLVQTSAALIAEDPEYSKLAARMLARGIYAELAEQGISSFSTSIEHGHACGLISDVARAFVATHGEVLEAAIDHKHDELFAFFGLKTVYDRYLLRDPYSRRIIESPQHFFMRVASGLSRTPEEAIELYSVMSKLEYLPSSPTLFNSATVHSQMSSCYLLDSPVDDLESIYERYKDVAKLSKHAGGIGLAYSRVRSRGSLIKGTNGLSNGIVPWLKTLDSSVAAVNQGGRRKGAACVYLETWHADITEFLELRDNTGDEMRRTYNLNLANWVPDLFMKRVATDGMWSLFDPKEVPLLTDSYGPEFERAYEEAEKAGRFVRQLKARDLYARMMRTLAQTGNGWMTFKDACNAKCNQTGVAGRTVHSSNLCTEIVELTSQGETAVCNLGSINLAKYVSNKTFDYDKLRLRVRTAVKFLDRVIDINFYPTPESKVSNDRWRPVGLGVMGLQDAFFRMGFAFDDKEALALSSRIQEEIYFSALETSCELAEQDGPHVTFAETRAAKGDLQHDLWGVKPTDPARWEALRTRIKTSGLRNSLLIAIAPTATIASISGSYECIEPQVSNLFKRETMSGEFLQVNWYLVRDLKARGLWTESVREAIKAAEGSVQDIAEIPADLKHTYRTAWELPQRALIDMAAARSPWIDQSQSLNLFMATPTIGKLASMYHYAWEKGLKTTYYLRSRPASTIAKTQAVASPVTAASAIDGEAAVACSLENPGACEACQ